MYRRAIVFAGLASLVAAASKTCTEATITITAAAQATLDCDVVPGSILVSDSSLTTLNIDGPEQVGTLIVSGATNLVSLSSTSIKKIDDVFNMTELNSLSTLEFSALRSVGSIYWIALDQLPGVTFGTEGVTKVSKIAISDTFLNTLDGLNVATVDDIDINNNRKLTSWDSDLRSVSNSLKLQNNGGGNMVVNMPKLSWVNDMEIRNVKEFNVPSLSAVNQSIRFNDNEQMTSFTAPNLTSANEIAFTNNNKLTNVTFPHLTETEGAVTVQNNTALEHIDGFPELATIRGAMILRGSFDEASFPALSNVIGQGTVTSTKDITSTCEFFDKLHDNGDIQGDDYTCTSNNTKANEGGNGGNSNGESGDDGSAAGALTSDFLFALGVAVFGGMALL